MACSRPSTRLPASPRLRRRTAMFFAAIRSPRRPRAPASYSMLSGPACSWPVEYWYAKDLNEGRNYIQMKAVWTAILLAAAAGALALAAEIKVDLKNEQAGKPPIAFEPIVGTWVV